MVILGAARCCVLISESQATMLFVFLSFFAFWGWEGAAWTDGSSWLCVVCRVACVVLVLAVVESDLALALFLQCWVSVLYQTELRGCVRDGLWSVAG